MATAAKAENGNAASEPIVDFTQEAKVAVDAFLEAANLASENGKSLLDAQTKLLNTTLELGQEYGKVYGGFFLTAIQQYFDQFMAFRGEMSNMFEASHKKLLDLPISDQKLTLEAAEAYQAQTKIVAERVVELFTPVVK